MPRPDGGGGMDALRRLVSPRVGIIQTLAPIRTGIRQPTPPFLYRAVLSHFDFRPATLHERSAAGKGEAEEEAIAGAIGEAVERYCASHPDPDRYVHAAFAELGGRALDPRSLVLYSESQYAAEDFPYRRFAEGATRAWIPVRSLPGREERLVPAALVYLNDPPRGAEEYLTVSSSNGLAAGPDLDAAILAALYELVERDGFLIHWLNRLPAPRVDLSDTDGLPRSIVRHFRRFGVEVHAFNLSVEVAIPVVMGLLIDRSGRRPAAVVGLGCHLSPREALRRALMEACQGYAGELMIEESGPDRGRLRSHEDVRQPDDHSSWFARPESLVDLDFLVRGDRVQRIEELPDRSRGRIPADLETCVDLLARAGSRAFFVDVTTPDIAGLGLRVVRALATELQPIHFGYGRECRGGRRLFEVPAALGYATGARTESELNPCPHPLA